MAVAGTGITGTIAVCQKIARSSRSKPLLSRHLTAWVTCLFEDWLSRGRQASGVLPSQHSYGQLLGLLGTSAGALVLLGMVDTPCPPGCNRIAVAEHRLA